MRIGRIARRAAIRRARRHVLRKTRRRIQRALLTKCDAITDERTGGWAYVLAFAWIAYCYPTPGQPRTFLGNVLIEARADRAYRIP